MLKTPNLKEKFKLLFDDWWGIGGIYTYVKAYIILYAFIRINYKMFEGQQTLLLY